MSNTIDSLKNLTPDNLNGYDSKNPNDVLAVIVRCKYSIAPGGTAVEETFDFYLSPDGSKCYGKPEQNKNTYHNPNGACIVKIGTGFFCI